VKLVDSPDGKEVFILCRSKDRAEKEKAIHDRFEQRTEEALNQIVKGCERRRCNASLVERRVGKVLGKNSRAAGLFDVQVEKAFRIQKGDLSIRPVWHQKSDRVQSHILVCFLAYVLWKTLGRLCRHAGMGDEPRKVLHELAHIKLTDVILPTRNGTQIRLRCIETPTAHQQILLQRLQLTLPRRFEKHNL